MANTTQFQGLDVNSIFVEAQAQFRGLNPNEPGQWPILPKISVFLLAAIVVIGLGWLALLQSTSEELDTSRQKEPTLKEDYRAKLTQAVNLSELLKQKTQVEEYVIQLEKQLPGKADMDALLSDINQAGLGRGLQFELFRPGQVVVKDYYAELPIALKVSGRYHDIGAFAADIANLSRIVTLHNLIIGRGKDKDASGLSLEATARTYRYLDPAEIEAAKKNSKDKKGGKAKDDKSKAEGKK